MELEDCVAFLVQRLREVKTPVYKDTVIGYAMKLLNKHEAHLNLAKIDAEQDYVRDEEGGLVWDVTKLDHWYYRRFLGDRPEFTTGACPASLCLSLSLSFSLGCVVFSKEALTTCDSLPEAGNQIVSWTPPARSGTSLAAYHAPLTG